MRWVLITPFGMPVEPEVNRNFAMVSGVTFACAASAASGAASSAENGVDRPASGLRATTISTSGGTTASMARA